MSNKKELRETLSRLESYKKAKLDFDGFDTDVALIEALTGIILALQGVAAQQNLTARSVLTLKSLIENTLESNQAVTNEMRD